jgi:hypothetical protein
MSGLSISRFCAAGSTEAPKRTGKNLGVSAGIQSKVLKVP